MAKLSTYATRTPLLTDYASGVGDPGGTPLNANYTFAAIRDLLQANLTSVTIGSDVKLERDAANTLALRNGTNAQALNVYNTYTDASNYERGIFRYSSNVLEIGHDYAGTGTAGRNVKINKNTNGKLLIGENASFAEFSLYSTRLSMRSATVLAWTGGSNADDASYVCSLQRISNGVIGVRGAASTTGGVLNFLEQTAPSAPSANQVHIYAEDNGAGKTRLMALFPTGAAQQIAIEP